MRKVPITITLPENLIRDLHSYIPKGQISSFISKAVLWELEQKKHKLATAYRQVAQDEHLNSEFDLWNNCIGDGLDESNEY